MFGPELDGKTETERILHRLCARSFLRLWTYGNVFRDQAIGGNNRQGKEICDALIVFRDSVIIFSDKEIGFSDLDEMQINWRRWYKNAIVKSQRQLRGAERWLRNHPDRLFLDSSCRDPLLALPTESEGFKVYKVVVANGVSAAIREHFRDSGSLILIHERANQLDSGTPDAIPDPFTIRTFTTDRDIFHVFDESNLSIILSNLDTINDFVRYLDKREELFRSGKAFYAPGEEELLAYYLQHVDEFGGHDFIFDLDYHAVGFESGLWAEFEAGELYKSRHRANRQSYLWDGVIETVAHDLVSGLLRYPVSEGRSRETKVLEQLASESRFKRRVLSTMLADVIRGADIAEGFLARTLRPGLASDVYYLFLSVAKPTFVDAEEYREMRAKLLFEYCRAVRNHYHEATDIYGIATELNSSAEQTWDLYYYNGLEFTDEDERESNALSEDLGVYRNFSIHNGNFLEYPMEGTESSSEVGPRKRKGRHRNSMCECGSGRKYKHCCGRANSPSKLEWITQPQA